MKATSATAVFTDISPLELGVSCSAVRLPSLPRDTSLAGSGLSVPMLGIEVRVPQDLIGNVAGVITSKRGKIIDMQQKGILNIVIGEIPASETFDISEVMRGQTAGKAMWNTHFKAWVPAPKSIQAKLVSEIRKRKGLSPDPPTADEFIDKE